ncbi:hypothetical protein KY328_05170 [Candidatus Woesearchaeota archaeon]|nr:hypothetical protein [Candidatus Woesearchaeota archaeon]MBW3022289.1 hypothetical protein [Candidatus Woesearchaeota archaeon]
MKKHSKKTECKCEKSPFIAIPASLAGIFLVIALLFMVLVPEQLVWLNSIVWGFVVLGIVAMAFAYKSIKK